MKKPMRISNIEGNTRRSSVHFSVERWMFNVRRSIVSLTLCLSAISLAPAATTSPTATTKIAATTSPVTQPTAANLEVHEWAVFVVDGATGQMNPDGVVLATLPSFVIDKRYGSPSSPTPATPAGNNGRAIFLNRRAFRGGLQVPEKKSSVLTAAETDQPAPVGLIRLIGSVDSKVDVSITAKGGTFAGSWLKAEDRPNQILWRDLTISDKPASSLNPVGSTNWFTALRQVNSSYVSLKTGCEKFLTYDLQMPYASPLKIQAGNDFSLDVSNTSNATLHNLTLYQAENDTLRTVSLGDLVAVKPGATPTTKPAVTAKASPVAGATITVDKIVTITSQPSASTQPNKATTHPATSRALTAGAFKLRPSASTQPSELADAWKPLMLKSGVDPIDAETMSHVIEQYAFDSHRLTAVYQMDDGEFDRLLPVEVVPQPAKITRFGLVIVINADPSKGTIVDDLIVQLGDTDWTKRDAAYHALAAMGPAASAKLTTAVKNTDLEIAWRAERLLALMGQPVKVP